MRSVFAGTALAMTLALMGCGGGGGGKSCDDYFKKVEEFCKDAANKASCEGPSGINETTVKELKKSPNEIACSAALIGLDVMKDMNKELNKASGEIDKAIKEAGAASAPAPAPADPGAASAPTDAPK
jgi:hypothetical protein